ncbi:hypothetical protein R5R35_012681 [Gryllus longicercus]|uniref:Uncharacterized protein n=1 Tax=Gryllus longicercus TaxID=2509291 RepID=A0AAN9Z8A5_9ORTH
MVPEVDDIIRADPSRAIPDLQAVLEGRVLADGGLSPKGPGRLNSTVRCSPLDGAHSSAVWLRRWWSYADGRCHWSSSWTGKWENDLDSADMCCLVVAGTQLSFFVFYYFGGRGNGGV